MKVFFPAKPGAPYTRLPQSLARHRLPTWHHCRRPPSRSPARNVALYPNIYPNCPAVNSGDECLPDHTHLTSFFRVDNSVIPVGDNSINRGASHSQTAPFRMIKGETYWHRGREVSGTSALPHKRPSHFLHCFRVTRGDHRACEGRNFLRVVQVHRSQCRLHYSAVRSYLHLHFSARDREGCVRWLDCTARLHSAI